jgi:hypothetical protein
MTELDPAIFDDAFHGCAWAAYVEQARIEQNWPDSEATRRRACRHYENEIKWRQKPPA